MGAPDVALEWTAHFWCGLGIKLPRARADWALFRWAELNGRDLPFTQKLLNSYVAWTLEVTEYDELLWVKGHLQNYLPFHLLQVPARPPAFSIFFSGVCYLCCVFKEAIRDGCDETAMFCSVEAEKLCFHALMITKSHHRAPSQELLAFVLIVGLVMLCSVLRGRWTKADSSNWLFI